MRKESKIMNNETNFIPMSSDYVFTQVMKHPKVLIGFLSAVLRVPAEDIFIEDIQVKDRYLSRDFPLEKYGVLDIHAHIRNRGIFDIEMQKALFPFLENRSIFYICKMFTENSEGGKKYDQFQKVIGISVLGFDLIKDTEYFYSSYRLREDKRHTAYSDLLELHVIELNKLESCTPSEDDLALYRWACLMNAKSEEEAKMIEKDPYIEEALKEIERLNMDPKRRKEYESRMKDLRDYKTIMSYMKKEGLEQAKREAAANAIKLGLTNNQIHVITGLSEESIDTLRKR